MVTIRHDGTLMKIRQWMPNVVNTRIESNTYKYKNLHNGYEGDINKVVDRSGEMCIIKHNFKI